MFLDNRITDLDRSHGPIRIPIESDLQFQRAFGASFDRLPMQTGVFGRETL